MLRKTNNRPTQKDKPWPASPSKQAEIPESLISKQSMPDGDSRPEWMRVHRVVNNFGIGRSSLYTLMLDGIIKSAVLKRRGTIRGIRLVNVDSLRVYLNSLS